MSRGHRKKIKREKEREDLNFLVEFLTEPGDQTAKVRGIFEIRARGDLKRVLSLKKINNGIPAVLPSVVVHACPADKFYLTK